MGSNKWQQVKLADVCESIDYGFTQSATTIPVGLKFLRITDIVNGVIDWNSVPFCEANFEQAKRYKLNVGDIVIARTGATTGCSTYIDNPPPALFASYLIRLQIKQEVHSRFISYFLKSSEYWAYVHGVLGDKSAQPNASAKTLTQVRLRLPPLAEQRAIAHILSTLDDKIELNQQMNRNLEAIAQAIFKSWFVDFDPVRAKMEGQQPAGIDAAAADLFPDSFEVSQLGKISQEWKVKPLDQVANFLNGLALQKYPPTGDEYLPVIKIAELRRGITESSGRASSNINKEYVVEDGDILFSWSGSLEVCIWCGGKGALNQHLFKMTSTEFPKWFYYQWVKYYLPNFQAIAASKATTMGHIQRHHLTEAQVLVPPADTLQMMDKRMTPLINRIFSNNLESRTLIAMRDALLPKLMSGEIRVKQAEKLVEVVA